MKTFIIDIYYFKKTLKRISVSFEDEKYASIYASGVYNVYAELKGATGFKISEL